MDLTESSTTAISITATVVSPNTCSAITSVKAYLYRSGVGYTGCDTSAEGNDNHCYPEITCTLDANSCTDPTSASANYTCLANVQYHADPTDSSVTYSSQNWLATVSATTSLTGTGTLSTGVEMNSLTAIGLTTPSLEYGNLLVNQSNDPLNKIITTIPTGNVPLNQSHQGDGAGMCTDFSSTPSCTVGTPIDHSNQRYSLSASTSYASGTALTGSPVLVPIDIPKATNTNPTGKNTWWGISIPTGTATGQYDGRVFILPVKKEV